MRDHFLLLLILGLGLGGLTGCPSTDDDDSAGDDDDSVADDDDSVADDDDSVADDDDSVANDDDSAGVTLSSLTIQVTANSADTRGSIDVTFEAAWSDGATTNPTEATDGVVVTFTTTAGTDADVWAEPTLSSPRVASIDIGASLDGVAATDVTVEFVGAAPNAGDLIVHELLVDGTAGDANGDGTTDANQDAFVEFLSTADVELGLDGCQVFERDFDPNLPRHTFGADDTVAPGQALVVFGGGSADITPTGATVVVADNASDPGTPLFLHLDPSGDIIRLRNANGDVIDELAYGSEGTNGMPDANLDESITLSPQVTGTTFDAHSTVDTVGNTDYSPGTQADGTAF